MNCKTRFCVALAALSLLPALAAKPVHAQQTLSPALIAADIAVTEIAARRPLSAAERQQIIAIDQAQFRREPVWSLQTLRGEVKTVQVVRRMDPVRLADWRKACVAGAYFSTDAHLTPEEKKTYLAIYTRTNPIISADPTTKTVICERDIEDWVAASQMMAQKSGAPVSSLHAVLTDYARSPQLTGAVRLAAANMERNWTAYQLGWGHEPLRDQRGFMHDMQKSIRADLPPSRLPALGKTRSVAIAALSIAHWSYGDYPYSLSPRFAIEKGAIAVMLMQLGRQKVEAMHSMNGYVPGNP